MIQKIFSKSKAENILLAFFTFFCIVQGYSIWTNYAHMQLYNTSKYGLISSIQRSAIFKINHLIASNIWWLDSYIPKDVPIVLPPSIGDLGSVFTDQNLMQFYLVPNAEKIWKTPQQLFSPSTIFRLPRLSPGKYSFQFQTTFTSFG
jgi:hypothetical protein